jgi:hypothetical protein
MLEGSGVVPNAALRRPSSVRTVLRDDACTRAAGGLGRRDGEPGARRDGRGRGSASRRRPTTATARGGGYAPRLADAHECAPWRVRWARGCGVFMLAGSSLPPSRGDRGGQRPAGPVRACYNNINPARPSTMSSAQIAKARGHAGAAGLVHA